MDNKRKEKLQFAKMHYKNDFDAFFVPEKTKQL